MNTHLMYVYNAVKWVHNEEGLLVGGWLFSEHVCTCVHTSPSGWKKSNQIWRNPRAFVY